MVCTVVNLHFLVQQKAVTKNLIAGSCGWAVVMYNSLDTTMLVHLLKSLLFWNAIPISNCSFHHYFPHSWELKTFTVAWPSQYRISHFLWQNTKSIRLTLTAKALRMASRFPSAQLIPFYLSIWPQTLLGDCEAIRGPLQIPLFLLSQVFVPCHNQSVQQLPNHDRWLQRYWVKKRNLVQGRWGWDRYCGYFKKVSLSDWLTRMFRGKKKECENFLSF